MSARLVFVLPAAIAAAMLLAACRESEGEAADTGETPPIPVESARAARGDIQAMWSGTAPIEAYAEAQVVAKVGGEIREILAEEGDEVRKGQLLLRLDGERFRFEAQQAEANLQKLKRDYRRHLDLKEKSLISEGDFERIQYEMEALQATWELARLELSYTEIRAPIDGVVAQRHVKVGNTIEANTPVFLITSLEPLIAYLHVPEREYRRIRAGQSATIVADALPGAAFAGTVARVSPIVDPLTGTFKIAVEVNDAERLKPGMFGRVSIVYDSREDALRIPRSAIVEHRGQATVFVVEDAMAHRRVVQTGYTDAGWVEITDGLSDEDRVVVVGQAGLRDGAPVTDVGNAGAAENARADAGSTTH